jgi:hypothetical protein
MCRAFTQSVVSSTENGRLGGYAPDSLVLTFWRDDACQLVLILVVAVRIAFQILVSDCVHGFRQFLNKETTTTTHELSAGDSCET